MNSNRINYILGELNFLTNNYDNASNRSKLINGLLYELVGDTIAGVTIELINSISNIFDGTNMLRFASCNDAIYLINDGDLEKVYNGELYNVSNYLVLKNDTLEIINNNNRITYNINRPYHLDKYEIRKGSYLETDMFYNDDGIEYYRIQKTKSYDDSFFKYYFITSFHRIDRLKVVVEGQASIDKVNGIDEIEYTQEPYIIYHTGYDLDIDVTNYGHQEIEKKVFSKCSKN